MPWIIGIDEAGYGPNLGPLVMSCIAMRVPEGMIGADLWSELVGGARRHPSDDDGRVLVDDSKRVYSTTRGLAGLEANVLAALGTAFIENCRVLSGLIVQLCPGQGKLPAEVWYTGKTTLPVQADGSRCSDLAARFHEACSARGVQLVFQSSLVVNARDFNQLTEQTGSKGNVLAHGLMQHVRAVAAAAPEDALHFYVDKHGGRNTYAAMLQDALPDGMVTTQHESGARSCYSVYGGQRTVRFTIQPRADSEHFCVALASMVSKYLRELLMLEYNEFWKTHLPALKPTAGYPLDAERFFQQIQPVIDRLGIAKEAIWRSR